MKSVAIFVLLFILAGTIFYYGKHPKKEIERIVVVQPAAPLLPPPPIPIQKTEIKIIIPDLKVIPVKNGRTITNARIQAINSDGIVFICDNGMVQALFDDLPPEFRAYYAKKAEPVFVPGQSAQQAHQRSQSQSSSEPSQLEIETRRAQDKANLAQRIEQVRGWAAGNEDIIHRYETQSSFNNDPHNPNWA